MEASAAVIPSSRRLHREFHADADGRKWGFDTETGLFTIAVPGRGRSHAEFQLAGHWNEETGAFTWAWADAGESESEPSPLMKAAEHARRVGAHYWLRTLTAPIVCVGETEAWQLTMVCAYLSDLPMVAAAPSASGRSFVVLDRPVWEN
ncbi:hypothetical protein HKCCE3408_12165 [Rhodobacterales bacterium HKCCE3408]|nr:hypothetical protein [Rhodobacterales bacterium HKCCE3408]